MSAPTPISAAAKRFIRDLIDAEALWSGMFTCRRNRNTTAAILEESEVIKSICLAVLGDDGTPLESGVQRWGWQFTEAGVVVARDLFPDVMAEAIASMSDRGKSAAWSFVLRAEASS